MHLIATYKKWAASSVSLAFQKLAKSTRNEFSVNFKAVFHLFLMLGSEKFYRHSKERAKILSGVKISVRFEALSQARLYFSLNEVSLLLETSCFESVPSRHT